MDRNRDLIKVIAQGNQRKENLDFGLNGLDIVNATSGLTLVDPLNVMSGITCFKNTNLSPSPISIAEDSIKDVIAEPSSSNPTSWLYRY